MSSRHSKSLNATACTRVCTCLHPIVRLYVSILCVFPQPRHMLNLCVRAFECETGGSLLGLCQHRKKEGMQEATDNIRGESLRIIRTPWLIAKHMRARQE